MACIWCRGGAVMFLILMHSILTNHFIQFEKSDVVGGISSVLFQGLKDSFKQTAFAPNATVARKGAMTASTHLCMYYFALHFP